MRSSSKWFVVGARYTNRRGTYEVLNVSPEGMTVRYDGGQEFNISSLDTEERIVRNVALEEKERTPFPQKDTRNHAYFQALGFLAARSRIEAIVPSKAREGFEQTYARSTGEKAVPGRDMYYLHADPKVDKWGVELRVSFLASDNERHAIETAMEITTVAGSEPGEHRINNNGFIWRLFQTGFRLGLEQELNRILRLVPDSFRGDFRKGASNAGVVI